MSEIVGSLGTVGTEEECRTRPPHHWSGFDCRCLRLLWVREDPMTFVRRVRCGVVDSGVDCTGGTSRTG